MGMIDISNKKATFRQAEAIGNIELSSKAFNSIIQKNNPKGDVLVFSEIAGINGVKNCSSLLPLCHRRCRASGDAIDPCRCRDCRCPWTPSEVSRYPERSFIPDSRVAFKGIPMSAPPTLEDARPLLEGAERLVERALSRTREITDGGRRIDDHQVLVERVAYAATEARAASDTLAAADAAAQDGRADTHLCATALC